MRLNILAVLGFVFLFAGVPPLVAQEELRYYNITADEGLSQSVVNCICQDKQGFMWFGTQDGLNCYDGAKIVVYKNNPVDSNSVVSNNITCLCYDTKGILWIGTDGGLSALNTYTGKFTNYYHSVAKNSLSSNYIHSIYEDKESNIWVGTNTNGLNMFSRSTGKFSRYIPPSADTSASSGYSYVSDITEDNTGSLWIGTFGNGLYSFNKQTHTFVNYLQHQPGGTLPYPYIGKVNDVLFRAKTNTLLVGTMGSGLEVFDLNKKQFTRSYIDAGPDEGLSPKLVKDIVPDDYGNIWIAGANGEGLIKFDAADNYFSSYKGTPGSSLAFNDNYCNCIYISSDGLMWVGTNNGVAYYIPEKRNFVNYADSNDPNANVVMAIARDAEGKFWLGTNGAGISCYDENTKSYDTADALNEAINNRSVLALYMDKRDVLWIGTWGSGALGYNPISGKIIQLDTVNPAIAQTTVTAIGEDHTGKLWIGTYGAGVFTYDTKSNNLNHLSATLSDNRIYCFFEDKQQNMWIGTDGGGVNCYRLSDGKNTVLKKGRSSNTLSSNSINCIYQDDKGNMWFGTGVGLNKYTPSTGNYVNYFEKEGLPNDYIYCILPDKEGNLWMSTNKGLSKFNPNTSNEGGSAFKNYDEGDGLAENEFNQGAALKSSDGRLFFGGMNGMVGFHPEKVVGNTHLPPVYITSCRLFGKPYQPDSLISGKKSLTFSWKNNTLSFSFVGLDYEIPSKNKYSYMLEGVDKDWSVPSTMHFASYAQLPPGDYVFKVRACNNDGVWNNTGASLHIHIIPPFWRTTWFYVLCIVLAIVFIFWYTEYRTRRVEKEKKVLEAKVEARTHELAQRTRELAEKNKDITSSIEYAKRIQQAILPPLDEIRKHLPDTFILYLPKDIVSGDFYWFGEKDDKLVIAAADCTGHGVPGALMSMIGHNLLNQIVLEQGITQPATVLNHLNSMVQTVLKQGISNIDTTDGMDIALCTIHKNTNELEYAGAYRPLVMVRDGSTIKLDADKKPIGGSQMGLERTFKNHTHKLHKGDTVYIFSDGYADQFGGPSSKKFMLKRFIDKLLEISGQAADAQEKQLLDTIQNWKGANEQVDDILVIGISI